MKVYNNTVETRQSVDKRFFPVKIMKDIRSASQHTAIRLSTKQLQRGRKMLRKKSLQKVMALLLSILTAIVMMPMLPGMGSEALAADAPTIKLAGTTLTAGKYYKNVVVSGKTTGVEEGTSADYNYYLSEDGTELELNGVATDAQLPDDPNDPNAPKNMIDVSGGTLTLSFNGTNTVKTTGGAAIHLKNAGLVLNEKGTGTNTLTLDGTEAIDIEGASSTITSNSANVTLDGAYAIQTGSDTTALTLDGSVGSKITTATSVGEDFYVRGSRMTLTVNNIDFKGFGQTGIAAEEIETGSGDALVINGNDAGHLYLFCEGGAFSGIYAMNKLIINSGNIQVGGSDPDDTSSTPTVHQAQIAILSYGGSGTGDIDINGGKIRTTSSLYSILSNNNMNISGGADVNATGTENTSIGLFSRGTMTVQGAGTQVSGTGCASGITASDMVVKDGTVTGTGRGTIYPGVGIVSSGKIDISGGTVKGTAAGTKDEAGIKVMKQKSDSDADGAKTVLNISGGTVIADGGNAVGIKSGWANSYNSDGTIKTEGLPSEINISGGKITAEGGQAGIRANGENGVINITGGTVNAKAAADSTEGTPNDNAGISTTKSGCTVKISGGDVTAEGAPAADTYGSYGIHIVGSGSSLAISEGSVTARGTTNGIYGEEDQSVKLTGGHIIADGQGSGDCFNKQPDVSKWTGYAWRKTEDGAYTVYPTQSYAFQSGEKYGEFKEGFGVSFDANGGQGGPTDAVNVKLNRDMPTITALPTKAGYTFNGYYDKADGGTQYYNADGTSAKKWDKTENTTLYAQWKPAEYGIEYHLNDGTNASSNPSSYTIETEDITLADPTKKGYTFDGWYDNADFTGEKITKIAKGSTGKKDLYAKWTASKYTVKFDANGGSGTMDNLTMNYDESQNLTANGFSKTGYTFSGWNTKKDGSGTKYDDKASVKNLTAENNGTVTLYAQWKPIKYTIKYHLNGGRNASSNPSKYTVESDNITLAEPTRTGYLFAGWYKKANFSGHPVTTISKGSTGNISLHAKWTKPLLHLKTTAKGRTKMRLSWNKIKGASGYDVFYAKCGRKHHYKKIGTVKGTSFTKSGLKTGKTYKFCVRAYEKPKGRKNYFSDGLTCHTIAGNCSWSYTNAKKLSAKKKTITMKAGKTTKVSAKTIKYYKNKKLLKRDHAPHYRYKSTNSAIAAVSRTGRVSAKKAGKCSIYIYAQNGVRTSVRITVK